MLFTDCFNVQATHLQPINDLQKEFIADVAAINGNIYDIPTFSNEFEAVCHRFTHTTLSENGF